MPNRKSNIKQLNLQDLLRMTPSEIVSRAKRGCSVRGRQYKLSTRDGFRPSSGTSPTYSNEMRIFSRCTDGRRTSYVRFYGPPELKTPVWVWCDCPYFKYYLEVALTRVGASSINSSNGKPPTVRNPQMLPYLCKHLVVTADAGLRQTDDLIATELYEKPETEKKEIKVTEKPTKHVPTKHVPTEHVPTEHAPMKYTPMKYAPTPGGEEEEG